MVHGYYASNDTMVSKKAQKWHIITQNERTFAFLKPKYLKITRTIHNICFSQSARTLKSLEQLGHVYRAKFTIAIDVVLGFSTPLANTYIYFTINVLQ